METVDFTHLCLSLAFVILLIFVVAYIVKTLGLEGRLRGVTGSKGRLQVSEVLYIDPKRRLMLVRADKKEYLLLVAGDSATLIDTVQSVPPKKSKAA